MRDGRVGESSRGLGGRVGECLDVWVTGWMNVWVICGKVGECFGTWMAW